MSLQLILLVAFVSLLILFAIGVWMTVTSLVLLRKNAQLVLEKEKLSETIFEKNRYLDKKEREIEAVKTHVLKMKDDVKQKDMRIIELLKQT